MSKPNRAGVACVVALVSGLWALSAIAQDDSDEVSIDAPDLDQALEQELQEEVIEHGQRLAVSVSAFSFDDLELRGIHGLSDMMAGNRAGLLVHPSSFNSSSLSLSLRGIGGTAPHQPTGEAGVGVFIDGSYVARTQGLALDLLDIDSVEVVRGSQAVLGGRNTVGGAVYLTSSKPSGVLGLEQRVEFGEVGDEVVSVTHLNLPKFADILSAKVSYLIHRHDGWVDALDSGSFEQDNAFWLRDDEGMRVALRFDEGGSITYDYSYLNADVASTQPYFQVLSGTPPTGFSLEPEAQDTARTAIQNPKSKTDIEHHNNTITVRGDKATLTADIAFRDIESREFYNSQGIAMTTGIFGDSFIDALTDPDRLNQEQFSQTIKLDTQLFDGVLDLVVGLSNFSEQVELFSSDAQGSTDIDSFAVFFQSVLSMSDQFDLSFGVRETTDKKTIRSDVFKADVSGIETTLDDDNTDFKVALNMNISESVSSYLSYATGYKSAGASLFSPTLDVSGGRAFSDYDAETTETIEVGFKGDFGGVFAFALAAFSTDIDDRQIEIRDPSDISRSEIVNAPEASTIEGIEFDMTLSIADVVTISGLYTYLDAESAVVADPFSATGATLTANVAQAPEHMGSVALDLHLGEVELGQFKLHLDYTGFSSYFFDEINPQQGSRDVFNARVALSGMQLEDDSGKIEIGVWVHNFTDSEYLLASELVNRTGSDYTVGAFGEPRSFGVDIRYER